MVAATAAAIERPHRATTIITVHLRQHHITARPRHRVVLRQRRTTARPRAAEAVAIQVAVVAADIPAAVATTANYKQVLPSRPI